MGVGWLVLNPLNGRRMRERERERERKRELPIIFVCLKSPNYDNDSFKIIWRSNDPDPRVGIKADSLGVFNL